MEKFCCNDFQTYTHFTGQLIFDMSKKLFRVVFWTGSTTQELWLKYCPFCGKELK
jgi:chromosome condensin MukBEF complex kleisin-like MukF subunit